MTPILAVAFYFIHNFLIFTILPLALVIYYAVAEKLLEGAASIAVRFLELGDRLLNYMDSFDNDDFDEEYEGETLDFPDEHLLYVWGLASSIQREISPSKKLNTYIVVIDEGFPVEIYPYPSENDAIDLNDLTSSEDFSFKAEIRDDRTAIIYVPLDVFESLAKACERGEGERIKIEKDYEAIALYHLAKTIASMYEDKNDVLLSYLAYKAILKLRNKGVVQVTDEVLDELPLGDSKTKLLIRRQVSEELGFKSSAKTS